MNTTPLRFVELHTPLFLGKKNHGTRVYSTGGVESVYVQDLNKIFIRFNGEVTIIPDVGCAQYTPHDSTDYQKLFKEDFPVVTMPKTHIAHASRLDISGAQVSDPSRELQNPPMPEKLKKTK